MLILLVTRPLWSWLRRLRPHIMTRFGWKISLILLFSWYNQIFIFNKFLLFLIQKKKNYILNLNFIWSISCMLIYLFEIEREIDKEQVGFSDNYKAHKVCDLLIRYNGIKNHINFHYVLYNNHSWNPTCVYQHRLSKFCKYTPAKKNRKWNDELIIKEKTLGCYKSLW